MAIVQGVETRKFDVEINKNEALRALAAELGVYGYFTSSGSHYYDVKDNKIYSYYDTSYHGSPDYEETLACDDKIKVRNYLLIEELANLNEINLSHY